MPSPLTSAESLPGRILVVEDDRQIQATVASLLEEEGYDVETASDGREALARLREGPSPDLIILDLMLPAIDGWQFRTIQRNDPTLSTIPVLAVSADASAKAEAIDATSFLRKPFGADELIARVRKILTDRVKLEARMAETERLASLGMLAAEATHEMSNPLCSVVANLSVVEQHVKRLREVVDGLPRDEARPREAALVDKGRATVADMQDAVREVRLGTERVSRTLRDLRTTSRRGDDPFHPVDIHSVLDAAVALTAHEIRERARLVTEFHGAPSPPLIQGNEFRLGQLFTNLLLNAAQAIRKGSVDGNEIRVSVRRVQHTLEIEVRDTGSGMNAEVRSRLFEPFFTTKPVGVGTGLGLPVCQTIAREHRGWIDVESEPGYGSTFRVILPIDDDAPVATETLAVEEAPLRANPAAVVSPSCDSRKQ